MQAGIGTGMRISIITIQLPVGIGTPIIMAAILDSVSTQGINIIDLTASGFPDTGRRCQIG